MLNCKLNSTNGGTFSNSAEQVILIFFSFSEGLSYVKVGPGIQNFNNISSRNVKWPISLFSLWYPPKRDENYANANAETPWVK